MWVFDGEQWTEEGGGEKKAEQQQFSIDRFVPEIQPELQVEIVQVPRTIPLPFTTP